MKSNDYTVDQVKYLNVHHNVGYQRKRNEAFIELVAPIYNDYNNQLQLNNEIDFSDMINKAMNYVKDGKFNKKYSYIIVDEYQDISLPRYKLLKAIKDKNESKLFCVGDDWQSIYRFAGSDINLFTNFEKYFGYTEKSYIETTYSFSNSLIDLSSQFILKNPNQIRKQLKSYKNDDGKSYEVLYGETKQDLTVELKEKLRTLPKNSSILLLGRYRDDLRPYLCRDLIHKYDHHRKKDMVAYNRRRDLSIEFYTVHGSKGLQADYVFILNNISGKYGFPSNITDDKVLNLLLQEKENYEHAEERRLFYVALTRAKKSVFLLVQNSTKSVFIREIEQDNAITPAEKEIVYCPECQKGELKLRNGKYGEFYGCSNYPFCTYTQNIKKC